MKNHQWSFGSNLSSSSMYVYVCVCVCVFVRVCVCVCTCVDVLEIILLGFSYSRHKSDSDLHQSLLQEQQAANLLPPYMGTQSLEYQQPIPAATYLPASTGYQPLKYNVDQSQRRGKRKFLLCKGIMFSCGV